MGDIAIRLEPVEEYRRGWETKYRRNPIAFSQAPFQVKNKKSSNLTWSKFHFDDTLAYPHEPFKKPSYKNVFARLC